MAANRQEAKAVRKATKTFKSAKSSDTKTKRNVAKARPVKNKGKGSF